jgi:beta-carotene 3-hydroxylase
MTTGASVTITFTTFVAMELVAALVHRYIMHGWLWVWHEDHHVVRGTTFQKNDFFALVFAIPSWLLIMTGMGSGAGDPRTAVGLGILFYGIAYTLVHESIIHHRLPWRFKFGSWYVDALREAHAVHHRRLTRDECENFGMLLVPARYFRRHHQRASATKCRNTSSS